MARVLGRVCLVLACIGIPILIAIIAYSFWLSAWTRGSMDDAIFARSHAPTDVSSAISPTELQKAIEAAVDESIKREELLLDKLLLVVGLYSTILSVLALATVFASRQDAKEQLVSVNAKADALSAAVQQELAAIKAKAQTDVEALKAQVVSEFPIISRLQERVRSLILELEDRFPEDENLNRERQDSWQSEEQQQNSLIDESKMLAVSVVALDSANLLKLYLVLARFYFGRFKTGGFLESDAARSYVYASRAIKDNPQSADAYRTRGATMLARCDAKSKDPQKSEEAQNLLQIARTDFNRCIELDQFNAGAFYNLAWSSSLEYKLKIGKPVEAIACLDRAIQLSERLFAVRDSVPLKAKEKYFPDVFINWACFVAYKVKSTTDPALQTEMHSQIVKICTDGKDYLISAVESSKAEDNFKESLKRELDTTSAPKGDFAELPQTTKDELEILLKGSWEKPAPKTP
jgi:hypothetical protein